MLNTQRGFLRILQRGFFAFLLISVAFGSSSIGFVPFARAVEGAPSVVGSYPSHGETDVPVGSVAMAIALDYPLNAATVTNSTVKLMNGMVDMLAEASYNEDWQVIELTVGAALDASTTYEIQLIADPDAEAIQSTEDLSLTDTDGTEDGVHRISFTTGEADVTSPFLYYVMATQSHIYVTFSETMDEATATDVSNYAFESPIGTPVALTAEGGVTATYSVDDNTVTMEGATLTADDSFTMTVSNVTDISGNVIDEDVRTSSGTVYDEAVYDPGSDTYSAESWDMAAGFSEDDYGYVPQASAYPSNSLAGFASSYYIYVPLTAQIPSSGDDGKVIITFPSGTDVSGATNPDWSWTNEDANSGSPGTVAVNSIVADADARTVTLTFSEATACDDGNSYPCEGSEYDYISVEVDGIINPTNPRGYDTDGYSVDVQTMVGSTLLESFVSYPYYISEAGSNTISVELTAAGATEGTALIQGYGSSTGSFTFESAEFSGGDATATMSGVPDGDYWLWTDPMLDLDEDDVDDYVGVSQPMYVTVSGVDVTTSMVFTDVGSLQEVTIHVSGAVGKNVDVSAYGPGWQSEQIESTTGDDEVTFHLSDGDWWVYVWPHYDDSAGYVTPDYISPQPVYVSVANPEVSEDSGTSDDAVIEMALTTADNEIPFLIVDEADLPISSAWVWISDNSSGFWSYGQTAIDGTLNLAVNAGTFRAGVYVEGLPPSQEHTIVVDDDGLIFVDSDDTATELVTMVARVPDNAISGTVSDGVNPVSGASVYASCTSGCIGNSYSWAMTDTNGTFTFYVDNGTWEVGAYIPGYGYAETQSIVIDDSNQADVVLGPDPDLTYYTISGTVCQAETGEVDCSAGEGMSNVYLYAWKEDGTGSNYSITGSDGTYSIRVPAGDDYRLDAWDSELGSLFGLSGLDASSGDVTDADIVVVDPFEVTLRVEDAEGNPLAPTQLFGEATNQETGGRATFWIEGTDSTTLQLPPGTYELQVYSSSANLGADDISADSVDTSFVEGLLTVDGEEALLIQMPELFTLSGIVTNDSGLPVAYAWIDVSSTDGHMHSGAVTDETGTYSLVVEDGSYQLTVYYPGLIVDPLLVDVAADTTSDISGVAADRTISGTVLVDGSPVPYAYVMGTDSDGTVAGAQADQDGAFQLWVTDETWTLVAVGYGFDESAETDVEVDGSDVAGVALELGDAVDLADPLSSSITPSAGGVIQNEEAGFEAVIPENALGTSSETYNTVSVTETNNVIDTETDSVIGNGIEFDVTDSGGAAVTQFSDDLTFTWTFTVEELAADGIDTLDAVEGLSISYYDSSGAWVSGPTTATYFDEAGDVVSEPQENLSNVSTVELTATFDHATTFAVTQTNDSVSDDSDSEDEDSDGGGYSGGGSSPSNSSSDDEGSTETTETTTEADATEESAEEMVEDTTITSILSEADEDYLSSATAMAEMMGVARNIALESENVALLVARGVLGTTVPADMTDYYALINFVTYGTPLTNKLGSGERAGVLNSYKTAFGHLPETDDAWADVIKIAAGRWPSVTSETAEAAAKVTFQLIYLREADMTNANDNAAVTVMAYGLRPANRNLTSEAVAIGYFTDIFGAAPSSATDWDTVRAIAYSGAIR